MIGILLNIVHFQVHKNITKESDGFHNHSTQLTMAKQSGGASILGFPQLGMTAASVFSINNNFGCF